MEAKLLVVAGDTKATEIKLRLPSTIGRGREATLTVPHPLVSRQHCEIFEKDGFLVVRDLGSLNGTFIGDDRITEAVLHDGELLTVGTMTFRAVYRDDPNLSAPAREKPAPPAARERKPVFKGDPGGTVPVSDDDVPASTPQPAGPRDLDDGPDDEFTEFLKSVDVEGDAGDTEEAPEPLAEPTIEAAGADVSGSVDPEVDGLAEVEEIEEEGEIPEPEPIDGPAEPAEIDALDEVEEVEEIEGVEEANEGEKVNEAAAAAPAATLTAPKTPKKSTPKPAPETPAPAAAAPEIKPPFEPQEASNEDDDELQSFLKDLDL